VKNSRDIGPSDKDRAFAAQMKRVGKVLAGTIVLYVIVQAIGGQQNWPPRFALLADLAALAAFVWALVTTWRLWKQRNE
jgi:hypothetical protein